MSIFMLVIKQRIFYCFIYFIWSVFILWIYYSIKDINNSDLYLSEGQAILTPRNIFNIGLTYNKKGFLFGVTSKSQSSSYLDLSNQNKIDSFTILNSVIGYENDDYSVLLSVNNITSEKYYTNGSMVDRNFALSSERHLFTNPLINSFLTLRYKF